MTGRSTVAFEPEIDRSLPTPAYLQLYRELQRAIEDGSLRAGQALPSERELARDLSLSRVTIRRAIEELERMGLVEKRHGSGTYIRGHPLEQVLDRVLGFTDEARALGFQPSARLLEAGTVPADPDVALALQLERETPVLQLVRLRSANGIPLAVQAAHLAPHVAGLSVLDLESSGSLYRSLAVQFGIRPARARQTVAARLPSVTECGLLDIARTVPLLDLERTTFDRDDRPFEFVRSAYRGDLYRMVLNLRAADS